jgi:hypothetical protein
MNRGVEVWLHAPLTSALSGGEGRFNLGPTEEEAGCVPEGWSGRGDQDNPCPLRKTIVAELSREILKFLSFFPAFSHSFFSPFIIRLMSSSFVPENCRLFFCNSFLFLNLKAHVKNWRFAKTCCNVLIH